jgi:hypothetical protein
VESETRRWPIPRALALVVDAGVTALISGLALFAPEASTLTGTTRGRVLGMLAVLAGSGPSDTDARLAAVPGDALRQHRIAECVDERPDLRYERTTDDHTYYVRRGSARIEVRGTLGVGRDVLRNAALTVRPATDAEITSMLPPARTGHGVVGRLKALATRLYG